LTRPEEDHDNKTLNLKGIDIGDIKDPCVGARFFAIGLFPALLGGHIGLPLQEIGNMCQTMQGRGWLSCVPGESARCTDLTITAFQFYGRAGGYQKMVQIFDAWRNSVLEMEGPGWVGKKFPGDDSSGVIFSGLIGQ